MFKNNALLKMPRPFMSPNSFAVISTHVIGFVRNRVLSLSAQRISTIYSSIFQGHMYI